MTRISQWMMPRITPAHVWAYRALGGRGVDKATGGAPVFIVTTIGRRTGKPRTVVLGHLVTEMGPVVAGTNGGLESLPSWILNLRADPRCWVEEASERWEATAVFLEGEEWVDTWSELTAAFPVYDQAYRWAGRPIPLVRLERVQGR
jgi:deazaflavin-dependent oxidoreductase (nitroreductase family)